MTMLIIFAQFLARFSMLVIEQFVALDKECRKLQSNDLLPSRAALPAKALEREIALAQFRIFQVLIVAKTGRN